MKNLILSFFASLLISANAFPQVLAEIDPVKTTIIGWDSPLPDATIKEFNIYKRQTINNVTSWLKIGTVPCGLNTTALDLKFTLPKPAAGVYVLTAVNTSNLESDYSETLTLTDMVPIKPLAPTNLRVIQQ